MVSVGTLIKIYNATNFAYLTNSNKSFARPSRTFLISAYFFHVLGKSATWNDHFSSFTENMNTLPRIWIFFPSFDTVPRNRPFATKIAVTWYKIRHAGGQAH